MAILENTVRTPERTIGVLVLQHYEEHNAFSERDLGFMASVGDQIALAIERKWAEDAAQVSEERYRDLVENAIDMIYTQDLDGNYISINAAAEKITGYTREETLTRNLAQSVAPEQREKIVRQMKAAILSGTDSTAYELEVIAKDGRRIAVEVNTRIIRENGVPVGVQGIARDITERKRIDDELRESEQKYRAILDNIEDGYFEVDIEGNLTFFNDSLCDIFGYSRIELLGMNNRTFMDDENARKVYQTFNQVYRTGIPARAFDWEIIRKDGTMRFIEASVSQRKDPKGQSIGFRGVLRDITARKEAEEALRFSEEQLRQSLKLEAVGQLAGGIAHDFNNLLTAITGYSQLSLRKLPADDPVRTNVEEIAKAGERAAALTRQLLAFSRKQVLTPTVHNLNTVITEIEKMLKRLIRENIELRTVLAPDLGNIKADPGQIEQVIVNLAVNARDAMPHGGTLTIATQNIEIGQEYVSGHIAVEPGKYIKMTVTDTGEGMDEKTRSRIFEPFFTTKAVGSGTGLGLSTVHGIVSQSGGSIQVYSEPGHGTTFKIYLPCVDENVQRPRWRDEPGEDLSGNETILLVEDEDVVRGLVREILIEKGYTVLEAASGKGALSICSTYEKPIDLLFTDIVMPKMSGDELSVKVVKLRPDIKVLFMSGYTDESVAHRGIIESNAPFIEKPFTPEALARKVRAVLAS
jgi:PAS domain S-box-containing protein